LSFSFQSRSNSSSLKFIVYLLVCRHSLAGNEQVLPMVGN
jgi:hypothetical protein